MRLRQHKREAAALGLALGLLALVLGAGRGWALGLAGSSWPMFRHDARHSGRTEAAAPRDNKLRWWQETGAEGKSGSVFASPAVTSEHGLRKIWYLHTESWRDSPPVRNEPGAPDVMKLRSQAPDAGMTPYSVAVSKAQNDKCVLAFETMPAIATADYDPFRSNLPKGDWRFVCWAAANYTPPDPDDVATQVYYRVYRFAYQDPDSLEPLFTTGYSSAIGPEGGQYTVDYTYDRDTKLAYTDGIRVEMYVHLSTASDVIVGLTVELEGDHRNRVETPIWEKGVVGGSDDGYLYAFDASSGNVFWTVELADAGRIRGGAAIDDENVAYVGTEEDDGSGNYLQGCLYAVRPDGAIKWIYPAEPIKFYLLPAVGTVPGTAMMDHVPGGGANDSSGCSPGADTNNYWVIQPRALNAAGLSRLPAAFTSYAWVGEKDWAGRRLLSGEWVFNLALRVKGCGANLPRAELYYRISKIDVGAVPLKRYELLGWTKCDELLQPPAEFNPGNETGTSLYLEVHTPQVVASNFQADQYPCVEFALRQTSGVAGTTWHLVTGSQDSQVQTAGLNSGKVGAIPGSPALSEDGIAYFATLGGWVYAMENSGELRWEQQIPTQQEIRSSPAIAPSTSPTPGRLYVGGMDGYLYALDGNSGALLTGTGYEGWPVNLNAPIESSPAIKVGGALYVGTNVTNDGLTAGRVVAIDGNTGAIKWAITPSDAKMSIISSPAISAVSPTGSVGDEPIYVGSDDGHLYKIGQTGADPPQVLWQYPAAGAPDLWMVRSSPLLAFGWARDRLYLTNEGLLSLTAPGGFSQDALTGTGTGYLQFRDSGPLQGTLSSQAPVDDTSWRDEFSRGTQTLRIGTWHAEVYVSKLAAGDVRQQGYLWYRITKKRVGSYTTLLAWTRHDQLLDAADTAAHLLAFETPEVRGGTFRGDERIYVEFAIQQTVGGLDVNDGWRLSMDATPAYVETAPVGGEQVYFGAGDGRVYCLTAAGSKRWDWPDSSLGQLARANFVSSPAATEVSQDESLYLSSSPGAVAGTAQLARLAGTSANWATEAVAGTAVPGKLIQLRPVQTNSVVEDARPSDLTTYGWISEVDRKSHSWAAGKWRINLVLQVNSTPAQANLWYRLSKVRIQGNTLTRAALLRNWTRHGDTPISPPAPATEVPLVIETPTMGQVSWGDHEYPYLELYLETVSGAVEGLTWSLEVDVAQAAVHTTGTTDESILYIGGLDWNYYAIDAVGSSGLVGGGTILPGLPSAGPGLLRMAKSANRNVAGKGDIITYTIRVRNDAPPLARDVSIATGLQVQDTVPVGAETTDDPPQGPGTILTFNLGDLLAAWSRLVQWPARITTDGIAPSNTSVKVQDTNPLRTQAVPIADPSGGASRVSGVVTITTTQAHMFTVGEVVVVSGVTGDLGSDFNGTFTITETPTARNFRYNQAGDADTGGGGTAALQEQAPNLNFDWGQALFVDLKGRGQPAIVENEATATGTSGVTPITGRSNKARTEVGYGHRYKLTFVYTPNINPSASPVAPVNQPVTITTELQLSATKAYRGVREEAVETEQPPDRTVFKVELSPRGLPYSPSAVSMTEPPNRPWPPFHWQVQAQQINAKDGKEDWYPRPPDPPWQPSERSHPNAGDLRINEPLAMLWPNASTMPPWQTTKPGLHAGTSSSAWGHDATTGNPAFVVQNISMFSMSSASASRPVNVCRWDPAPLGRAVQFPGAVGYVFYDENNLPACDLTFLPRYANVSRGRLATPWLWAEVPRYLSEGVYRSTGAASHPLPPMGIVPIYVDLNGNQAWDPAETLSEYWQEGGEAVRRFYTLSGTILSEPRVAALQGTMDLSRHPYGESVPGTLTIYNEGNTHLLGTPLAVQLGMPLGSVVGRSDLPPEWPSPEGRPLDWTLSGTLGIRKTPVGSYSPLGGSLVADPVAMEDGQPVGHYLGHVGVQVVDTGTLPPTALSTILVPLKVTVGERRVLRNFTGQEAVGMDIYPYAYWNGLDSLRLYWSSNRRVDNTQPGSRDPVYLYGNVFDRAHLSWGNDQQYPAPGSDPLDDPDTVDTRKHLTASEGLDATGREWLFWGGVSTRTSGGAAGYDHRLLWTDYTDTFQSPNPVTAPVPPPPPSVPPPRPGAASSSLRLHPRPLLFEVTRLNDDGAQTTRSLQSVFAQGEGDRWRLLTNYLETRPGGQPVYAEAAIPLGSDLVSAQQPAVVQGPLQVSDSGQQVRSDLGVRTYYLHAEQARNDPEGRKRLDGFGPDALLQGVAGDGLVASFITEPGDPGVTAGSADPTRTAFPFGNWWFQVMASSAGSSSASLRFRVYQVTALGATNLVLETAPSAGLPAGVAIGGSGAQRATNIVTITTTAPHGLVPGDLVEVSGVAGATDFNGTFTVLATPSADSFRYVQAAADGTGGGGQAALMAMVEVGHSLAYDPSLAQWGAGDRLLVQAWSSGAGSAKVWFDGLAGSRVVAPVGDNLADVIFSGRSQAHGNYDLYWARYDARQMEDEASSGLSTFPYVREQASPVDATGRVYLTRHQQWLVRDEQGHNSFITLYVYDRYGPNAQDWGWLPVRGIPGRYDKGAGIYPMTGAWERWDEAQGALVAVTRHLNLNPDAGRIEWDTPPTGPVAVDYAPRLLRLTDHAGNDAAPAAFVETYRYLDDSGARQPAGFRPRLWVFWVRHGGPGLGSNLYGKTYRLSSQLWSPGWVSEERPNNPSSRWDAGETLVPLDHGANEFGISACKDPRLAQVWLFWSSTRGKPPVAGAQGQYDTDLYYQVIAPPLTD